MSDIDRSGRHFRQFRLLYGANGDISEFQLNYILSSISYFLLLQCQRRTQNDNISELLK